MMHTRISTVALDADDTLWRNEILFALSQDRFVDLLKSYHDEGWIRARLNETEMKNLEIFGYEVKGFVLSMIETAIELTEGRIRGEELQVLIQSGKEMLRAPIEPLPQVRETLSVLAASYRLVVIPKGDLLDQESKIARSGLGMHFQHIEVLSKRDVISYRRLLDRLGIAPGEFLMVGNSLRSDILPVLDLGGWAVHVPYKGSWAHEDVEPEVLAGYDFPVIAHLGGLPEILADLDQLLILLSADGGGVTAIQDVPPIDEELVDLRLIPVEQVLGDGRVRVRNPVQDRVLESPNRILGVARRSHGNRIDDL